MTEERDIKTVPVYYENDVVGSAVIETWRDVSVGEAGRCVDAWAVNNIKVNEVFKFMFLHLYNNHGIFLNVIIDRSVFRGIAVTIGFSNYHFVVNKDIMRYPFKPELKEIEFGN